MMYSQELDKADFNSYGIENFFSTNVSKPLAKELLPKWMEKFMRLSFQHLITQRIRSFVI
jgi:hypothetical protein